MSRSRPPSVANPRAASCSRSLSTREVLRLRLEHHVEVALAGHVEHEALEADRVDQVRVGPQLRQHDLSLYAAPAAELAGLSVEARRRVVDLRGQVVRPGGERGVDRLAVAHPGGVVAVVMEHVPDHAQPGAAGEVHHGGGAERAIVVLDDEAAPGRVAELLEAGEEAVAGSGDPSRGAAHV